METPKKPLYSSSSQLHPLLWERLAAKDPVEICENALAYYGGDKFSLPFLGRTIIAIPGERKIFFEEREGELASFQEGLAALFYLAGATADPPAGKFVPLRELKGGSGFFRGPHAPATAKIEMVFGENPAALVQMALKRGWESSGEGDASVSIRALPKIPLKIILWGKNDEFAASATVLMDAGADLHLPLDAVWALANCAEERLVLP